MAQSVPEDAGGGQGTRSQPRRFVTIREVATDAGVGIATVSRALNGQGYVAADVRERILGSAERLGYRPSQRARSMRNLQSMTLGVVVPELVNPVYLEFLRGVEEVAHRNGYVVVIGNSRYEPERERAILERLVSERADGVVMGPTIGDAKFVQAVADQGIAVVPPPGRASQGLDRAWRAAESRATEHMTRRLLELGHRRITLVGLEPGPGVSPPPRYRRSRTEVMKRVMAQAGADLSHLAVPRVDNLDAAVETIGAAARQAKAPTAYISATHLLAPAVLFGLKAVGLDVPRDVSFVTYGDSDWAAAYRPALSVISHDQYGEAVQLAEMLLGRIRGGGPSTVTYRAHFVERESCGPPPPTRVRRGQTPPR